MYGSIDRRSLVWHVRAGTLALILALSPVGTSSLPAAPIPPPTAGVTVRSTPVFADASGWGVRKVLSYVNSRERAIQVAVGCMCLALFIIVMRKLHE